MTLEDVKNRLKEIEKEAEERDHEVAHSKEKELFIDVLTYLSKESEVAKEALKSLKIDFARWFS